MSNLDPLRPLFADTALSSRARLLFLALYLHGVGVGRESERPDLATLEGWTRLLTGQILEAFEDLQRLGWLTPSADRQALTLQGLGPSMADAEPEDPWPRRRLPDELDEEPEEDQRPAGEALQEKLDRKSEHDRQAMRRANRIATWNAAIPPGSRVAYRRLVRGPERETRTRSHAWALGDGTGVVLLEGEVGGWFLDFVRAQPALWSERAEEAVARALEEVDALAGDLNILEGPARTTVLAQANALDGRARRMGCKLAARERRRAVVEIGLFFRRVSDLAAAGAPAREEPPHVPR